MISGVILKLPIVRVRGKTFSETGKQIMRVKINKVQNIWSGLQPIQAI